MSTWGTVLSPAQIDDLVALIAAWRKDQTVSTPVPPTSTPTPAATPAATPTITATTAFTIKVAGPSNSGGPGPAVNLTGDEKAGAQVFTTNCVKCHGLEGKGGVKNPGST